MSNAYNIEAKKNVPVASIASATFTDLWTPSAGKLVRVLWASVTAGAACRLQLRFGTTLIWEGDLAAAGSKEIIFPSTGLTGAKDEKLQFAQVSAGAVTIGASAAGREEA